jgi:predicted flap endonuclease-1-like 5' DNA nuclease
LVDTAPGTQSVSILKGLGPKIAMRLDELGITRIDQLAWLDDAEAAQLDAQLGVFQGRMERDRWREQARLLAQGDRSAYEAQFGKLG